MSGSYKPNPDALPESPYDTAFLSQRDLGLNVPINYVTAPGVSLTAACFPFLNYEDDDATICLSNLLADGFRRLEVDLYWDQMRKLWSLCPIAIPVSPSSNVLSPTPTSTLRSTTASLTVAQQTTDLTVRQEAGTSAIISSSTTGLDSTSTSSPSTHALFTANLGTSSLESTLPTSSTTPTLSNKQLFNIGSYTCTSTINLSTLISILLDYIQKTQNTIDAHLLIITLNIHAVKSHTNTDNPAPQPTILPEALNTLGLQFSANLSAYIYTPNDLRSNRANLNTSWYSVPERYRPALDYYTTTTEEFGVVTTEDGWPSEAYIEFSQGKRMLLQFGSVDPQMAKYNIQRDTDTIFPPGYMENRRENDILASADGIIESGCLLSNTTSQEPHANSSWASASNPPTSPYPTPQLHPDPPRNPHHLPHHLRHLRHPQPHPASAAGLAAQPPLQNLHPLDPLVLGPLGTPPLLPPSPTTPPRSSAAPPCTPPPPTGTPPIAPPNSTPPVAPRTNPTTGPSQPTPSPIPTPLSPAPPPISLPPHEPPSKTPISSKPSSPPPPPPLPPPPLPQNLPQPQLPAHAQLLDQRRPQRQLSLQRPTPQRRADEERNFSADCGGP